MSSKINIEGMSKVEYINTMLPYRKMEEGLGPRPTEVLLEMPEVPQKDLVLYRFDENMNILFTSEKAARGAIPYIYHSYYGDPPKRIKGDIISGEYYTENTYLAFKENLEDAKRVKEHNERVTATLNNYDYKVSNIINELEKEWKKLEETRKENKDIKTTFKEFLELCNMDKEKALGFLFKTYKNIDPQTIENILFDSVEEN